MARQIKKLNQEHLFSFKSKPKMRTNMEHDDYADSDDDGNDDCTAASLPSPYHSPQNHATQSHITLN